MTTPWQARLAELIAGNHSATGDPVDAGAQLVVNAPEGGEVFRQGLARHHRAEPTQQLIWVRPLVGGIDDPDHGYLFNLSQTRRRALNWVDGHIDSHGNVVLDLRSGEVARIEPADGAALASVERWDRFGSRLTAAERAALDRLDADSWHGSFA